MAKRDSASKKADPMPAMPVKVPSAPEMREAWARLEAGDNRAARRLARAVLDSGGASADGKDEATDLLHRIGYDPGAALSVATISLVVMVILVLLTVTHKFD